MRVIALLSITFGFLVQMYLDGQTFTHAIIGIICGVAAALGGWAVARKEYADVKRRWLWWIVSGFGLALALFCIAQLPEAYRFQTRFNERSRKAHEAEKVKSTTDQ